MNVRYYIVTLTFNYRAHYYDSDTSRLMLSLYSVLEKLNLICGTYGIILLPKLISCVLEVENVWFLSTMK